MADNVCSGVVFVDTDTDNAFVSVSNGKRIVWSKIDEVPAGTPLDTEGRHRREIAGLRNDLANLRAEFDEVRDLALDSSKLARETATALQSETTDRIASDVLNRDYVLNQQTQREREMNIKESSGMVEGLKDDAAEAAWRLAGSQFVKLARAPLAAAIGRHLAPGDESVRGKVAAFLETDLGEVVVTSLLAVALSAVPSSLGQQVPALLAGELRVRAMAAAGDLAAELVMGPLREVLATFLRDVPAPPATPRELGDGGLVVGMPTRAAERVGGER